MRTALQHAGARRGVREERRVESADDRFRRIRVCAGAVVCGTNGRAARAQSAGRRRCCAALRCRSAQPNRDAAVRVLLEAALTNEYFGDAPGGDGDRRLGESRLCAKPETAPNRMPQTSPRRTDAKDSPASPGRMWATSRLWPALPTQCSRWAVRGAERSR